MSEPVIWVFTPSYFDVDSFLVLEERIKKVLAKANRDQTLRVVFIDDSAGQDPEIPEPNESREIIRPPYNLGHQGALTFALRLYSELIGEDDLVVTLDSDGEDRPEDIPLLIGRLENESPSPFTVVLAQRTKRSETLTFKVMYSVFKLVFWSLTGTLIRSGNFMVYRGKLIKSLIGHPFFDYCYSSTFVSLRIPILSVPLPRGERYFGKSKMNFFGLITHGLRMLLPFAERISVRAIIAAGLVFGVSAIATAVLIALSGITLFASIFALLSLFSGLLAALALVTFAAFNNNRALTFRHSFLPPGREKERDNNGKVISLFG